MSVNIRQALKLILYGALAAVIASVLAVRWLLAILRTRSLRARAIADEGTFDAGPCDVARRWPGTTIAATSATAWNLMEGVRRGRRFAAFDVAFANWYGRTHLWSVVVVECAIPPGTPTAGHKRGFAPWRIEFGSNALLALTDQKPPADEFESVLSELNDVLDAVAQAGRSAV